VLENDFPLFTRYLTPTDSIPRGELLDWGTRAVVGGVDVAPGDVIVSDVDRVVVVPAAISTAVLREAEALADTEDAVRQAVRDGVDPLDAYERHGVL
jgi:regulator of RNase E activity RraA